MFNTNVILKPALNHIIEHCMLFVIELSKEFN